MKLSNITIVIVSYYRGSRLNKCLDTLNKCPNIIVWDNNTTGEELDKVKQAEQNHPNVKFIDNLIMNQLSYEVSNQKFISRGFNYRGNLEDGIKRTLDLFESIKNEF